MSLLMSSSRVPLLGDIGLPVPRAAVDVVETAHREEVVALVVVQRLLVAQPPPDRVGVGVDLEVVGVVVDVGFHRGHHSSPLLTKWPNDTLLCA